MPASRSRAMGSPLGWRPRIVPRLEDELPPTEVAAPAGRRGQCLSEIRQGGLPAAQQDVDRLGPEAIDQVQGGQSRSGTAQAVPLDQQVRRNDPADTAYPVRWVTRCRTARSTWASRRAGQKVSRGRSLMGQHGVRIPQRRRSDSGERKFGGRRSRIDPGQQSDQAFPGEQSLDRPCQLRVLAAADEPALPLQDAVDLDLGRCHARRMRTEGSASTGLAETCGGSVEPVAAWGNGNHAFDPPAPATRRVVGPLSGSSARFPFWRQRALKYFASGWCTISASVDCSGCSCSSSDSSTPIRSGWSRSTSLARSSRSGQAG